ncbi:hypothetical protein HZA97_01280 [Candidatus Woesearchaeota archaeon]|nr:hypothetical protein [Candidatus Woesearchaeota archaeon]
MRKIKLIKILEMYSLFGENIVAKMVNKNSQYVKRLLHNLAKEELIYRIERGKYTCQKDVMSFASNIKIPAYISLWTALKHHNLIQQQPFDIFVMTKSYKRSINFNGIWIRFIVTKHMFGYKKERYHDFDIFIAEKEKAIIDCMLYKIPLEEVTNVLKTKEIDCKKLALYAKMTKNKSLIKRLGYLLEKIKKSTFGLKALDNNYIHLDYSNKRKGIKNKRWKLIINT